MQKRVSRPPGRKNERFYEVEELNLNNKKINKKINKKNLIK